MSSGSDGERSGEQPAVAPTDGSSHDSVDSAENRPASARPAPGRPVDGGPVGSGDTTTEPAAPASAGRPGERRRKTGVQYRPV